MLWPAHICCVVRCGGCVSGAGAALVLGCCRQPRSKAVRQQPGWQHSACAQRCGVPALGAVGRTWGVVLSSVLGAVCWPGAGLLACPTWRSAARAPCGTRQQFGCGAARMAVTRSRRAAGFCWLARVCAVRAPHSHAREQPAGSLQCAARACVHFIHPMHASITAILTAPQCSHALQHSPCCAAAGHGPHGPLRARL